MGNLIITALDDTMRASLAARDRLRDVRSVEEVAGYILQRTLDAAPRVEGEISLGDAIHALFAPLGGVNLPSPVRVHERPVPFADMFDDDEDA